MNSKINAGWLIKSLKVKSLCHAESVYYLFTILILLLSGPRVKLAEMKDAHADLGRNTSIVMADYDRNMCYQLQCF